MTDGPRIPAFVNPEAGNAEKARDALASTGLFDVREVDPAKLESEVRAAVAAGAKRILMAGGDGSIATAAGIVAGTDIELAVLPAGTMNHFAKDLGIPLDFNQAATVAAGSNLVRTDAGYVGERIFLNTSSIGAYVIFARVRERFEARLPYKLASLLALISTFLRLPKITVELEVEGRSRSYRTPLVFIGVDERELQFPTLGNRVKEGRRGLHIMVIRDRGRAKLIGLAFSAIFRGVKEASRSVELDTFMVERCRITMRKSVARVAVDGEIENMNTPLDYRIERDALQVVVGSTDDSSKPLSPP